MPQPRTCEQCKGPYRSFERRQKYCSFRCYVAANRGENSSHWRGGKPFLSKGYLQVKVNRRNVPLHRIIMEKHLGRPLLTTEIVHHRDHDKLNNLIENLEVVSTNVGHSKLVAKYYRDDVSKECASCHAIKPRTQFALIRSKRKTGDWDPHFFECKDCWNARKRRDRVRSKDLIIEGEYHS